MGALKDAYKRGINHDRIPRDPDGWSWPGGESWQWSALEEMILAKCSPGMDLEAWVEAEAKAFARHSDSRRDMGEKDARAPSIWQTWRNRRSTGRNSPASVKIAPLVRPPEPTPEERAARSAMMSEAAAKAFGTIAANTNATTTTIAPAPDEMSDQAMAEQRQQIAAMCARGVFKPDPNFKPQFAVAADF
jgi:hypothetical protein